MRRASADGVDFGPEAYVFGDETGQRGLRLAVEKLEESRRKAARNAQKSAGPANRRWPPLEARLTIA
jgi:hypothetical protein